MAYPAEMTAVFAGWNILLGAMIWDAKEKRVPNAFIAASACMGIALQITEFGLQKGLFLWGKKFFGTFLIMYLFYLLHALGAGDVKLICVISGMFTGKTALYMTAAALVLGAAAGVIHLLFPALMAKRIHFTYFLGVGYCVAVAVLYLL